MALRTIPGTRATRTLVIAAATGAATGLVVTAFEQLAQGVALDAVLRAPLAIQAIVPLAGLALAAVLLRTVGAGTTNATSDEYIRAFHERQPRLPLRHLPGKLLAGVATIGSGGALGLEGPSIYAGATIGTNIQDSLRRFFTRDEAKVMLTAGAAAGVAAVFKTPATGVVFALEAPYRDDVAHRALLPALVASATSYLVYVSAVGTEPVIGVLGERPELDARSLGGALAVGVLAGLVGRLFAWLIHRAKALPERISLAWRVAGAGAVLGILAAGSDWLFGEGLTLGPGYDAMGWATDPDRLADTADGLGLIALLLVLRVVATVTTVGASGTGGLFIPLAVQGAILGRLIAGLIGEAESALYPVIGLAAVLGAAYRAPLAAVVFVAETQRGDVFIIPALIAAAVSQLVVGRSSVSAYQRDLRQGHLERRFTLPITAALHTDVMTVPPDATLAEFVFVHVLGRRERTVPVVEAGKYVGMCGLDQISGVEREEWEARRVIDVMRTDLPVGRPSWTLRDAVAAMESSGSDLLPVCDAESSFVGVVAKSEIVKLDEILDETGG